jgi:hypothetical protein
MATMRLISMCALFTALVACGNPNPRSYADQGVVQDGGRGTLNTPYYTGADPSHQPRSGGGN